jgi:hypothetical protein
MTKFDFEKIRGTQLEEILIALDAKPPLTTIRGAIASIARWSGLSDARTTVNKEHLIKPYLELRDSKTSTNRLFATLILDFDVEASIKRNLKELIKEGRLSDDD